MCCVVLIYFRTLLQRPCVRLGGEREPTSGSGQDSNLDGPGFRVHRLWLPSPVCIASPSPCPQALLVVLCLSQINYAPESLCQAVLSAKHTGTHNQ